VLSVTNVLVKKKLSVRCEIFEPCGVMDYCSRWRKDVVNQCLDFGLSSQSAQHSKASEEQNSLLLNSVLYSFLAENLDLRRALQQLQDHRSPDPQMYALFLMFTYRGVMGISITFTAAAAEMSVFFFDLKLVRDLCMRSEGK